MTRTEPTQLPEVGEADKTTRRRSLLARLILLIIVFGVPGAVGLSIGAAQAGAALVYSLIGVFIAVVIGIGIGWKRTLRQKANIDLTIAVLLLLWISLGFTQREMKERAKGELDNALAASYSKYQAHNKEVAAKVAALDLQNTMTPQAIVDPVTRHRSMSNIAQYRATVIEEISSFPHYLAEVRQLTSQSTASEEYKAATIANANAKEASQSVISVEQTGKVLRLLDAEDALLAWGEANDGHLELSNGMVMYDTEKLGAEFAVLQANFNAAVQAVSNKAQ